MNITHRILPWRFGMRLSVRSINVMDCILMRLELGVWRRTLLYPYKKMVKSPFKRALSKIPLREFKITRNCGGHTISEIYAEMMRVGIKPGFVWPEPLPEPKPPRQRCPTCGHILYPKHK